MEFAVKRFARNILLLHVVLLAVVLGLVLLASRAIRQSAREQAQQQAEVRQRMLANQTARGIEGFYKSILSDMDLMPRPEEDPVEQARDTSVFQAISQEIWLPPMFRPATQPARRQPAADRANAPPRANADDRGNRRLAESKMPRPPGPPNRGLLLGHVLGRQLEERVTHLFVVARSGKGSPAAVTTRDVIVEPKPGDGPTAADLADRYGEWLRDLPSQGVSRFELFTGERYAERGYNLVALPIARGNTVLVAAVPVATVTSQFLASLNADPSTTVLLLNDSLTIMAGSRPALAGTSIVAACDPDFSAAVAAFRTDGFAGTRLVEHPFAVAGQPFEPMQMSAEPIDVAGRKWFIVVGSPLERVEAVVAQMFDRIAVWAVFVVVVIAALLASTSAQLIRGRLRLERVRTDAIRQELDRARLIQQAWLPRDAPACDAIDVAAVNFPANHISGDFYNWFALPDGRVAVAIGDVTGHGMSAAFLMATTQLLVRTTMQRITDPAAALAEVNRQLCTLVFNGQFVTLQILVLDPDAGTVEVSSAGHPAPLLADADAAGTPRFVPLPVDSQLVLGVDPAAEYETTTLDLPPGAALLMYTDGAPDVIAPNGSRFGNAGLLRACPPDLSRPGRHARCGDAKDMLDAVVASVNHFRGSRELADDLTFVAIRVTAAAVPAEQEPELVGAA